MCVLLLLLPLLSLALSLSSSGVPSSSGLSVPASLPVSLRLPIPRYECPSSPHLCPSTSVCCSPGLCCPPSLPFCITTPLLSAPVCGTSEAKVRCTVSTGVTLLGTLCASDPGVCCPFENFDRCTQSGPVRCVNNHGFIRCVVGGASKPGVWCAGRDADYCCPNPTRCCKSGVGCCKAGTGGPAPVEPFPRIVLGAPPQKRPGAAGVVGNATRPHSETDLLAGLEEEERMEESIEPSVQPELQEYAVCGTLTDRTSRVRCVRKQRRRRRLCRVCRRRKRPKCAMLCRKNTQV